MHTDKDIYKCFNRVHIEAHISSVISLFNIVNTLTPILLSGGTERYREHVCNMAR